MFHQIGRGPAQGGEDRSVVQRLLECHDRIRRCAAIALRLGGEDDAPDDDVRAAANAVIDYVVRALPLHSADEDESIAPRIAARGVLADELGEIRAQHRDIHSTVETLVPLWKQLAADPSSRSELRPQLVAGANKLQALFDEHLGLEESKLLPAIDELPAEVQDEIIAEMMARRE